MNGFNVQHPTFNTQLPTSKIQRTIARRLDEVEAKHNVRILWAVESGSRAWGFASPDSDYDVRFIYVHRPEWYLTIEEGRDVIELPVNESLDISGWDLRKALRLFRKSNPVLMEWLVSPLVYRRRGSFVTRLRTLAKRHHSKRAAAFHYLHMAEGNHRAYLIGNKEVNLKKYLYVLRPLVAILWLIKHDGIPPMGFQATLDAVTVSARTRRAIDSLLRTKATSSELGMGQPIPAIDTFIVRTLQRAKEYAVSAPVARPPVDELDGLFRAVLKEAWR